MGDRELRASLALIGVLVAGLELDGELVDGRRKALMCAEMGIEFPIQRAQTLKEACSILWTRHPARALELAGKHKRILELAELCSTSSVAIAKEIKANKPKRNHHRQTRILDDQPFPTLKNTSKMVRRLFLLEPELYAYAKEAAAQSGHRNVNQLVRDAVWREVARVVPNAPQFQPRRVQPPNGARASKRRSG